MLNPLAPLKRAERVRQLTEKLESVAASDTALLDVQHLAVELGEREILSDVSFELSRGELVGVVGASGTGKSVLTRAILGLVPKTRGRIIILQADMDQLDYSEQRVVEQRLGVMFQHGALFSSLTVKQNVQVPMREYLDLSPRLMDELAILKIQMVGLKADAAEKFPSELSGGMIKRAALARALALDPDILFLDEPTSGLDPIGAGEFDELMLTLQQSLGLTVFMVTHDLDSIYATCDRVIALGEGKVIADGPISAMLSSQHPWLKSYFHGKRGRSVTQGKRQLAMVREGNGNTR
ncbi:MAG: ATP-binding cassette domain-containing protein [Hyphomicrobiales bacterium]|nr:ATP-binding cassette domain-containing protein [Hyphomicrobiales bacterium]